MNKNITTLAIVLASIGGAIIAFSFYTDAQNKIAANQALSKHMKDNFVGSCIEGHEDYYNYCTCAYDKLENKLGTDGVLALSEEYDVTGVLPKGTVSTISECLSELK